MTKFGEYYQSLGKSDRKILIFRFREAGIKPDRVRAWMRVQVRPHPGIAPIVEQITGLSINTLFPY